MLALGISELSGEILDTNLLLSALRLQRLGLVTELLVLLSKALEPVVREAQGQKNPMRKAGTVEHCSG